MPFESKSQQRWMFWKHPVMAKRWSKETLDIKSLPEKVGKAKGGMCYNDGGLISSDTPKIKPSYYDTDISKVKIKAHKVVSTPSPIIPSYSPTSIRAIGSRYNDGGYIEGDGTSKSDNIPARVKKGSFVVPAENALMAEVLRSEYLENTPKANLNQKDGSSVRLSAGEHLFSPKETKIIGKKTNLKALAPNANKKTALTHFLNHVRKRS